MTTVNKHAFIWDLDGTLLDSYGEIVSSTRLAFAEYGIRMDEKSILNFTIQESGKALLEKVSREYRISFDELQNTYMHYHHSKMDEVTAAPNAELILKELTGRGDLCFVFTHRGSSTVPILKRLKLYSYFTEIITAEDGFPRKPAPEANLYLIEKYRLDRTSTYFVGDRKMDMECADRAGIKKILYRPEYSTAQASGMEDHIIKDFLEIKDKLGESEENNGKILY